MVDINFNEAENIAEVAVDGTLTLEAVIDLRDNLNNYINKADKAPNLVIKVAGLPHWDSLAAMGEHLKLVHDHHRLIGKVAVVGDNALLGPLPMLIDHFVGAKLRHFKAADLDKALNWARTTDPHPGAFKVLEGFPHDVIALEAVGQITSHDYSETLMPLFVEKLSEHDQIKLYCKMGDDFDSVSAGAIWDDIRLGLGNPFSFAKCAIVTDLGWMRLSAKLFGPLIPAQLMVFSVSDEDSAKEWIRS